MSRLWSFLSPLNRTTQESASPSHFLALYFLCMAPTPLVVQDLAGLSPHHWQGCVRVNIESVLGRKGAVTCSTESQGHPPNIRNPWSLRLTGEYLEIIAPLHGLGSCPSTLHATFVRGLPSCWHLGRQLGACKGMSE